MIAYIVYPYCILKPDDTFFMFKDSLKAEAKNRDEQYSVQSHSIKPT